MESLLKILFFVLGKWDFENWRSFDFFFERRILKSYLLLISGIKIFNRQKIRLDFHFYGQRSLKFSNKQVVSDFLQIQLSMPRSLILISRLFLQKSRIIRYTCPHFLISKDVTFEKGYMDSRKRSSFFILIKRLFCK